MWHYWTHNNTTKLMQPCSTTTTTSDYCNTQHKLFNTSPPTSATHTKHTHRQTHLNFQFVCKHCIVESLLVRGQGTGPHPHLQAYRCPARPLCLHPDSSLVFCVLHHTTLGKGMGRMTYVSEANLSSTVGLSVSKVEKIICKNREMY